LKLGCIGVGIDYGVGEGGGGVLGGEDDIF
jgi:hypothetical protein